jgi:hypothetical protein
MTSLRRVLLGAAVTAGLLAITLAVLAWPSVQTRLARRWLESRPGVQATVGSVAIGWRRIEITELRLAGPAGVLTVPRASAEASMLALLRDRRLRVENLVAEGWELRLEPAASLGGVSGLLGGLLGCEVGRVDLAGRVGLPFSPNPSEWRITGGPWVPGATGAFAVEIQPNPGETARGALALSGTARFAVSSDGEWERGELHVGVAGEAPGSTWSADWSAAPAGAGEEHRVTLRAGGREAARMVARRGGAGRWEGEWRLDVLPGDVSPLGRLPWPVGEVTGEGTWSAAANLAYLRVAGHVAGTLPDPGAVAPALAGWGGLRLAGDFDVTRRGEMLRVERLEISAAGAEPVATVRSLQPFEFNWGTRELRSAEPLQELLGVRLEGVPVAWLEGLMPGWRLSGGAVRGELSFRPMGQGVAVRSVGALVAGPVFVAISGKPALSAVSLSASVSGDHSPEGWQVELRDGRVLAGEVELARGSLRAGRITGAGQAVKLAGGLELRVGAWTAQPVVGAGWPLTAGEARIEFGGSLGEKSQWRGRVGITGLMSEHGEALPSASADVRFDWQAGRLEADVPLELAVSDRRSDVRWTGSLTRAVEGGWRVEGQLTGARLEVASCQALAPLGRLAAGVLFPGSGGAPWSGVTGELAFRLGEVRMPDGFTLADLRGRARVEPAALRGEGVEMGWGGEGKAAGSVEVLFRPGEARPWEVAVSGTVREIELGTWLRRPGGPAEPTLEGRGDVTGRITARARTWEELATEARAEFELTSKGGVFRGLRTAIATPADPGRGLAGLFASAGSMLAGGLGGRKPPTDIAGRAEAVAELARGLGEIAYDQLSVRVSHDAAFNTVLRDFNLIAPQLRVSGYGTALHKPGRTVWEDALAMKFALRARGRLAELLQYLGVLDAQADALGYKFCMFPAPLGGSLVQPDATELRRQLTGLAAERGGLTDRAADLLNRLFGAGR